MGLYNFQKRFVSKILSGEKTHTIRAKRAVPDKPGNMLHLYTGLRQKGARLLMRAPCVKVEEIEITSHREAWAMMALMPPDSGFSVKIGGETLSADECEALARRDGFDNFAQMMMFWDGRLPFKGDIIHWRFSSGATRPELRRTPGKRGSLLSRRLEGSGESQHPGREP